MRMLAVGFLFFFFQAEDGIRDYKVTGVQTCALPISSRIASINASAWGKSIMPSRRACSAPRTSTRSSARLRRGGRPGEPPQKETRLPPPPGRGGGEPRRAQSLPEPPRRQGGGQHPRTAGRTQLR